MMMIAISMLIAIARMLMDDRDNDDNGDNDDSADTDDNDPDAVLLLSQYCPATVLILSFETALLLP